ncbi:hypothetical protein HOC67_03290, partial [Candidatus Peregrinibacteria bacterium]|nr:hypothetical protein [Candidatus Peregrinibacteria bacterium]
MLEPSDKYLAFWIQKYIDSINTDQHRIDFRMDDFSIDEQIYAHTRLNIYVVDITLRSITPELQRFFTAQLVGKELTEETKLLYAYIVKGNQLKQTDLRKAFSKFFHDFRGSIDSSLWKELFGCFAFKYCIKVEDSELLKKLLYGLLVLTKENTQTFSLQKTKLEWQDALSRSEALFEN